jgi:hypothetical protein
MPRQVDNGLAEEGFFGRIGVDPPAVSPPTRVDSEAEVLVVELLRTATIVIQFRARDENELKV